MANTIAYGKRTITVVFDGSTAYDAQQDYRITSMRILPKNSTSSCVLTVRSTSASGATLTGRIEMTNDKDARQLLDFPDFCRPYVKGSEATSGVTMIIHYE